MSLKSHVSSNIKTYFRSLPTRPANKKVLLFGDDGHVCDNIRGFLEAIRIGYSHVKNFDSDISVLPKLYDRNSNPDFASVIFCSFRKSYPSFHAGPLPLGIAQDAYCSENYGSCNHSLKLKKSPATAASLNTLS